MGIAAQVRGHGVEVVRVRHDHEVIAQHARLAVLAIGKRDHGVADAKAADEQGHTAGDADDRHEEAALVAEDVARGHLVQKAQAAPDGTNALKKDAASGLGRLGAHERGRRFAQLVHAGHDGRAHDSCSEQRDGEHGVGHIEMVGERR